MTTKPQISIFSTSESSMSYTIVSRFNFEIAQKLHLYTPRPRAALLMCQKKYSAIGNIAIGNYVVLYSKLILKQCY